MGYPRKIRMENIQEMEYRLQYVYLFYFVPTQLTVHIPLIGSDILYLRLLRTHVVILNSEKAVRELLDKRSKIYSDRWSSRLLQDMKYC